MGSHNHFSKTSRVKMQNTDPTDKRMVICDYCARRHSKCDGMLPCRRCKQRGEPQLCAYSSKDTAALSSNHHVQHPRPVKSTRSPIISALLLEKRTDAIPSKLHAQPGTRDIVSDSESDEDDVYADIVHEDGPGDDDTIEIASSKGPTPSVHVRMLSLLKDAGDQQIPDTRKRRASDSIMRGPRQGSFQPPSKKRARLDSEESPFKPSGGTTKGIRRYFEERPITRLSTSAVERPSYRTSPTIFERPTANADEGHYAPVIETIRPSQVPAAIREVFANMGSGLLLDVLPDATACRGPKILSRFGVTMKTPGEYSTKRSAIQVREMKENMSDLELILLAREKADSTALRKVMKSIRENPLTRWNHLSEAEHQAIRAEKQTQINEQRDDDGRSATCFNWQLVVWERRRCCTFSCRVKKREGRL